MQNVLNPTKYKKYVALVSYPKERSKKRLPSEVYLKISKAQINRRSKHQIFANVALIKIDKIIFIGSPLGI